MKLAKRGKIQLMLGAARLGPWLLVKQVWLALLDSFVRKRHLVFRLDPSDCPPPQDTNSGQAQLREVLSPDDILEGDLTWLNDPVAAHDWGAVGWLQQGWRLWLLEENGRTLALAWVRNAEQSSDFFAPLEETEELFWHVYVLPGYRGRNLQQRVWSAIARHRIADGVTGFFTNCRDYNLPSRANIIKMGFLPIGHCDESRITRHRTWNEY